MNQQLINEVEKKFYDQLKSCIDEIKAYDRWWKFPKHSREVQGLLKEINEVSTMRKKYGIIFNTLNSEWTRPSVLGDSMEKMVPGRFRSILEKYIGKLEFYLQKWEKLQWDLEIRNKKLKKLESYFDRGERSYYQLKFAHGKFKEELYNKFIEKLQCSELKMEQKKLPLNVGGKHPVKQVFFARTLEIESKNINQETMEVGRSCIG